MIRAAIEPARNPGGLVSVIYDRAGAVVSETSLSAGDDIDALAERDGETFNAAPGCAVIYDGDAGSAIAAFKRDETGQIVSLFLGIPS